MFAVVKNTQSQFYSIRSAWLQKNDEDGKLYAFYPPESKMKKYLEKGVDIKSSWKYQEVEVSLDNIEDLNEAEDFIQRKLQYVDSEASELDKKMKSKKRKLDTTDSFHEEDFDAEFDGETSCDNLDEQIVPSSTPLQDTFSKVGEHSGTQTFNEVIINNRTSNHATSNQQVQPAQLESMVMIPQETYEYLLNEVRTLKTGQFNQMQQMKEFMEMVRDEFKALKESITSQKNGDIQSLLYKPPVIESLDQLKIMEEKFHKLDESFKVEYTQMYDYFVSTVSSPNKNFNVKNGVINSLMKMYLDQTFAKSMIYKSTKRTVGFDAYNHHIRFFFITCNKVLSNMGESQFINTDDTKKSIQRCFKAIHATPKEDLPPENNNANESQDAE